MAHIPDFSSQTYCPWIHEGIASFSIGWLGNSVPRTGPLPAKALDFLRYCAKHHTYQDGFLGCHSCEICGEGSFHGEFWVEFIDPRCGINVRFVLPSGVFHYIEQHAYCPPAEFLDAIQPLAESLDRAEDEQAAAADRQGGRS